MTKTREEIQKHFNSYSLSHCTFVVLLQTNKQKKTCGLGAAIPQYEAQGQSPRFFFTSKRQK
ncbi:hypothetical protein ACJIZ3_004075 [Penstemon smallii]|uniref:Uncharacterized protein n=1 Tax=Penstemon smallii TaxID=265156 RepID=A0ABD3S151_9LAMI